MLMAVVERLELDERRNSLMEPDRQGLDDGPSIRPFEPHDRLKSGPTL